MARQALHALLHRLLPSWNGWTDVGSGPTTLACRASDCDVVVWPGTPVEEDTETMDALQATIAGRAAVLALERHYAETAKMLAGTAPLGQKTARKKARKKAQNDFTRAKRDLCETAVRPLGFSILYLQSEMGLMSLQHNSTGVRCDLWNGGSSDTEASAHKIPQRALSVLRKVPANLRPPQVAAHVSAVHDFVMAHPTLATVHMAIREALLVPVGDTKGKRVVNPIAAGYDGGLSGYVVLLLIAQCETWGGFSSASPPSDGQALLSVCKDLVLLHKKLAAAPKPERVHRLELPGLVEGAMPASVQVTKVWYAAIIIVCHP